MSIAIKGENLGKRYAINQAASTTLRDLLTTAGRRMLGRSAPAAMSVGEASGRQQELWALRNVSFEVSEGERIGIIGANGAGKSTLLKILSRVTTPTEGRIEIRGKVASLLEVGTGFHPELSGRENVYLNGAILGMSAAEIRKKFDQIVDFSGVEKFLDTPVKHYSSGMYVRLAFAVSAWLDPDILIVDEVLAVGDAAFQRKCAERMKELTREGRTVLFVSHSMASINQMCQKALYLAKGEVVAFKPVGEATDEYQRTSLELEDGGAWHRAEFVANDPRLERTTDYPGKVDCLGGSLTNGRDTASAQLPIDTELRFTVRYRVNAALPAALVPSLNFYDQIGAILFVAIADGTIPGVPGDYTVTCRLPPFLLNNGRFTADANLSEFSGANTVYSHIGSAFRFEIIEGPGVDPRRNGFAGPLPGYIRPRVEWRVG